MNTWTLAVDASNPQACICLLHQQRLVDAATLAAGQHSRQLTTAIMNMITRHNTPPLGQLAFIAGPGSFTGLRIAAATLNGLNTAWQLPVRHLSSLMVMAARCEYLGPLWVLEDARAGEYFTGCYQQMTTVQADRCVAAAQLPQMPVYTGHQPLPELDATGKYHAPDYSPAQAISRILTTDSGEQKTYAEPHYLQRSQAERMRETQ